MSRASSGGVGGRGRHATGKRKILGVCAALSEHEAHWRAFLERLKQRGMGGVQLMTSDDHAGLGAARPAVLAEISEEWLTGRTYISFEGNVLRPKGVSKGTT